MKIDRVGLALAHGAFTMGSALLVLSIFPQHTTLGWLAISIASILSLFFWQSPIPAAHVLGAQRMFVWFSLLLACVAFGTLYVPSTVRIIAISIISPLLLVSATFFMHTKPARLQESNRTMLLSWAIALGLSFPIAAYFVSAVLLGISATFLILSAILAAAFIRGDPKLRIHILPRANLKGVSLRDVQLPILLRAGAVCVAVFLCLAFSVKTASLALIAAPLAAIVSMRAIKTIYAPILGAVIGAVIAIGSVGTVHLVGAFIAVSLGIVSLVQLYEQLKAELPSRMQKNQHALFGVTIFGAIAVASVTLAILYSTTSEVQLFSMGLAALTVLAARH